MDINQCVQILSKRKPHTHGNSENDQANTNEQVSSACCQPSDHLAQQSSAESDSSSFAEELKECSLRELVARFQHFQQKRVSVYRDFHKGFDSTKATGSFPAFCQSITLQFASLSQQINNIEQELIRQDQTAIAQWIRKIQLEEKEKLLLTSALLVEQMRLEDAQRKQEQHEQDDDSHQTTIQLLTQSIDKLNDQNQQIVVRINELLDNLLAQTLELREE